MSEEIKLIGEIIGFEKKKEGTKKDGTVWKNYHYRVKEQDKANDFSMWGFIEPKEFMEKEVQITYVENPNPKDADKPYKNVTKIEEVISDEEHIIDIETKPQGHKLEEKDVKPVKDYKTVDEFSVKRTNEFLFGQVLNKTIDMVIANTMNFKEDEAAISEIFNHLWEFGLKKRKEKLEV